MISWAVFPCLIAEVTFKPPLPIPLINDPNANEIYIMQCHADAIVWYNTMLMSTYYSDVIVWCNNMLIQQHDAILCWCNNLIQYCGVTNVFKLVLGIFLFFTISWNMKFQKIKVYKRIKKWIKFSWTCSHPQICRTSSSSSLPTKYIQLAPKWVYQKVS